MVILVLTYFVMCCSIDDNHARHVNVQQKPDDNNETGVVFFIIPERSFSSFHDLYGYYTANAICNLEQVTNVKLLNPLNRAQHIGLAPASSQPRLTNQTPIVTQNEIPPLPRKLSICSGIGPDFIKSVRSTDDVRHSSSSSQASLPELPPIEHRPGWPSLDSQGSEHLRTSSGSSGSGTATVRGSNTGIGAVGGVQYIAPGSPGFDRGLSLPSASFADTDLSGLGREQEDASQRFRLYQNDVPSLNPASSVSPPLSKKEQKKLQKMEQKEEKHKKKEEKKMKKKNKKAEMDNLVQLGWCRPPMPTPERQLY